MADQLRQYADDIEKPDGEQHKSYAKLTLVSRLGRLTEKGVDDPLNTRDLEVNCLGIWARPSSQVQGIVAHVLDRLSKLLGDSK